MLGVFCLREPHLVTALSYCLLDWVALGAHVVVPPPVFNHNA